MTTISGHQCVVVLISWVCLLVALAVLLWSVYYLTKEDVVIELRVQHTCVPCASRKPSDSLPAISVYCARGAPKDGARLRARYTYLS